MMAMKWNCSKLISLCLALCVMLSGKMGLELMQRKEQAQ